MVPCPVGTMPVATFKGRQERVHVHVGGEWGGRAVVVRAWGVALYHRYIEQKKGGGRESLRERVGGTEGAQGRTKHAPSTRKMHRTEPFCSKVNESSLGPSSAVMLLYLWVVAAQCHQPH